MAAARVMWIGVGNPYFLQETVSLNQGGGRETRKYSGWGAIEATRFDSSLWILTEDRGSGDNGNTKIVTPW